MAQVIAFLRKPMSSKLLFSEKEQALINAIPDGVIILDKKKYIIAWNKNTETLISKEALQSKKNIESILNLKLPVNKAIEIKSPYKKNIRLSLLLNHYHQFDYLMIIADITQRDRLEKMRQDFIANVSHELRTPLTVFHGYLELLLANNDVSPKQLASILTQMEEQNQRMENLVSDLLLLSRLEGVEPDLASHEVIDIPALIANVVQDARSLSEKNGKYHFEIEVDSQLKIKGEKEELRSAFSNLVYNAVRYTSSGGVICVRWYTDGNQAFFEVVDTGIGIEPKHIERLTERFYRVDKARSRKKGGTGLGLAIVKHVLLRHNAELRIKSRLDRGSTFCCVFPLR